MNKGRHPAEADLFSGKTVEFGVCPFPRALAALVRDRKSGTLSLELRQYEKHIIFQEGVPVFASSNVVEESLGRFLVNRGEISESVAYQALSQSVQTGKHVGNVLVEMGALQPYALFKAMRHCFGACILDAFRWQEGKLSFDPREPDVEDKLLLKIQPTSLLLRGICAYCQRQTVEGDFEAGDARYRLRPEAIPGLASLQLNTVESRIVRALQQASHSAASLASDTGVSDEMALRLLYALVLIGAVGPESEVAEELNSHQQSAPLQPGPEAAADAVHAESTGADRAPLTDEEKNAIDRAYLVAKSQSYYELLGIDRGYSFAELRGSFLGKCDVLSPMSYRGRDVGDLGDQLEELFLILVRAFMTLADSQLRAAYDRRVEAAKKKSAEVARNQQQDKQAPKENPFAITSEVLDARMHIKNGLKLLNSQRPKEAIEHFRFAVDVDAANAEALAYLGYAIYLADPTSSIRQAMHRLQQAMAVDPRFGLSYFLLGRILEMQRERPDALRAYKECLRCDPDHKGARAAVNRLQALADQQC